MSSVWIQRVDSGTSYRQLNIPTGGAELSCRLGRSPTVRGPATAPVAILRPGTTVIGVRLRPGAASTVLGVPAATLRDTAVDMAALWGRVGPMVAETVNDATDAAEALSILQGHLLARARWADPPDPLVAGVVRELRGNTPLAVIGDRLRISERQLRRRCEAAVDLAPKTLHRLLRFQQFVACTQREFALGPRRQRRQHHRDARRSGGAADEAHLNRECLRLTGQTPRALLTNAEQQCACGHDHAASYGPQLAARDPRRLVSASAGNSPQRR